MTKKETEKLREIEKSITNMCNRSVPPLIDDCSLTQCLVCNNKAWLIEDIIHDDECVYNIL